MAKRASKKSKELPSENEVKIYELLVPLLGKIRTELKELSKKKQDGNLNALKVKMVNRVLTRIRDLLKDEATAEFLDLLDDETLPSNSDAVLIISQYDAALDVFKGKYFGSDGHEFEHRWFTQERPGPG